jgi:hypothetical protein
LPVTMTAMPIADPLEYRENGQMLKVPRPAGLAHISQSCKIMVNSPR